MRCKLILSSEVREADAKAEEEAKAAKASMKPEAREAQDVVMTEDDPPEKDDPSVSQKTSSEHSVGRKYTSIITSRD